MGNLSENLSTVIDLLVAALFLSAGALAIEPRIQDRRQVGAVVDDLKSPEVRLNVQLKLKAEVTKLVSTEEAKMILHNFPTLLPMINGLTLMNENEALSRELEASEAILVDTIVGGGCGASSYQSRAQQLAIDAIRTMTLPKDAKMVRRPKSLPGPPTLLSKYGLAPHPSMLPLDEGPVIYP